jgi:hypothetical protein
MKPYGFSSFIVRSTKSRVGDDANMLMGRDLE